MNAIRRPSPLMQGGSIVWTAAVAASIATGHDTELGKAAALRAFPTLLGIRRNDPVCRRFPVSRDVPPELIPWFPAPG